MDSETARAAVVDAVHAAAGDGDEASVADVPAVRHGRRFPEVDGADGSWAKG